MEHTVLLVLISFLAIIALGIIYLRDLLTATILLGVYSLVAAAIFVVMDAVDVAFTEAAVGAGISTILLLGALRFTTSEQKPEKGNNVVATLVCVVVGGLLIFGTLDMPHYGDANTPANQHPQLSQYYINDSKGDTGVPNIVTSVLASYRGYDTLGETVVVFTAAIAVLSLLGLRRRKRDDDETNNGEKDGESKESLS